MLRPSFDKSPWSDPVMKIARKAVWLRRTSSFDGDTLKTKYKVMHGAELMQLQGYDMSKVPEPIPDLMSGAQLAGNMFNAIMVQAFQIATTCASTIQDDPQSEREEAADDCKESYSYSSYETDGE